MSIVISVMQEMLEEVIIFTPSLSFSALSLFSLQC